MKLVPLEWDDSEWFPVGIRPTLSRRSKSPRSKQTNILNTSAISKPKGHSCAAEHLFCRLFDPKNGEIWSIVPFIKYATCQFGFSHILKSTYAACPCAGDADCYPLWIQCRQFGRQLHRHWTKMLMTSTTPVFLIDLWRTNVAIENHHD